MGFRTSALAAAGALVLVLAACGGSSDETTSTTGAAPSTSIPAPDLSVEETEFLSVVESAVGPTDPATTLVLGHSICRALRLFQAAAVAPPAAADGLRTVDLRQIPADDLPSYGAAVAAAPQTLCPDVARYADEVVYWLGI